MVVKYKKIVIETIYFRCGGIFSDSTITNFLLILTMKKFENWSIFDEVMRRKYMHFLAILYRRILWNSIEISKIAASFLPSNTFVACVKKKSKNSIENSPILQAKHAVSYNSWYNSQ